ncbi:MAG: aldo/keto reductase [Nitrososphaerota archaeon]|nr:aldo/keto reductase [Nitrososphaerota archaeon]MDG7022208.1 aldo/keto reductase [Nitrososphaerota archaeon]
MEYRLLGRTGLKVSRMTLGTNNFGRDVDEQTSVRVMRKAIDLGVNSVDTANVYTKRRSEEIIGKAIRGDRERFVIATKVGNDVGEGPNDSGLSRKHILWQVEESLRLLQTDHIDIYYMHSFDQESPLEETLKTFDRLVRDGKVRYVACSNFTVAEMKAAGEVSERLGLERIVALQPPYNLLNRGVEKETLGYCAAEGIGTITYSALAGGFLTGKYADGIPAPSGTRGALYPKFWGRMNRPENYAVVERFKAVARRAGIPLSQLALGWIAKNPAVTSMIVGASRPDQVEENVRQLSERPPADALAALDAIPVPPPT